MDLEQVRADWTSLGSADPLWAVLVSPHGRDNGWDPAQFLATGRAEIAAVLAHLAGLGVVPAGGYAPALDFGCGAGRLTAALAEQCGAVVGVDLSATMLDAARRTVDDDRCEFVLNDQPDLTRFGDASFGLVVSSLVLQHLHPTLASAALAELIRVTRPGGAIVVQVADRRDRSPRGMLARVLPRPVMRFAQRRLLGYPAPMDMYATSRTEVERLAAQGGARVADALDDPMYGGHWRYVRYYLVRT